MTPAQRETRMTDHEATLRELAAGLLAQGRISAEELYSYSPGQRADIIRKSERNADACLAGADALRRGTCGTCRWLRVEPVAPGYEDTAAVCAHESEVHPLHWCQPVGNPETFGCTFHEPTEPTR